MTDNSLTVQEAIEDYKNGYIDWYDTLEVLMDYGIDEKQALRLLKNSLEAPVTKPLGNFTPLPSPGQKRKRGVKPVSRDRQNSSSIVYNDMRRVDMSDFMLNSDRQYRKLFSMAKITNVENVPDKWANAMGYVVADGWYGDDKDATIAKILACRFVVGSDGVSPSMVFFFVFAKEKTKSTVESAQGMPFHFKSLVLQKEDKWYARQGYTDEDFKEVLSFTDGDNVFSAVESLGMEEVQVKDPLYFASSRQIQSEEELEAPNAEYSFAGLCNLVLSIANEFHYLHFLCADTNDGGKGHWDTLHNILNDYYTAMQDDFDTTAELAFQLGEDITHPNQAASDIGFEDSLTTLADGFDYEYVVDRIDALLGIVCDYAANVNESLGGGETYETADVVGAQNFLGDFLQRWTKERNYKNKRRMESSIMYKKEGSGVLLSMALSMVNDVLKTVDRRVNERAKLFGRECIRKTILLTDDGKEGEVTKLKITYQIIGKTPIEYMDVEIERTGYRVTISMR